MPAALLRLSFLVSGYFSALAVRRFAREMSSAVIAVAEITSIVDRHVDDPELIDGDGRLRAKLLAMREKVQRIHGNAVELVRMIEVRRTGNSVLLVAVRQLASVCGELFEALTELYWDIGEHDASFAQRKAGYVAATPAEVNAVLDRIIAGE